MLLAFPEFSTRYIYFYSKWHQQWKNKNSSAFSCEKVKGNKIYVASWQNDFKAANVLRVLQAANQIQPGCYTLNTYTVILHTFPISSKIIYRTNLLYRVLILCGSPAKNISYIIHLDIKVSFLWPKMIWKAET